MDTTPTIRPVLDLDNVYTGMADLDTMFSTKQARIAGSAYATTHDNSVERLEDAYRRAIMEGNLELANLLLSSEDNNVIVNVNLNGSAADFFDAMVDQTVQSVRKSGVNPLMVGRRNTINA